MWKTYNNLKMKYHPRRNAHRCKENKFQNHFAIKKNRIKLLQKLLIPKTLGPQKKYSGHRFSLLIGNDTSRIMVGCRWCTYPSIHFFHGAGTLKITVGCPPCTYPGTRTKTCTRVGLLGPHCTKKGPWARPPVLTPVPSQAIHSRTCSNFHHYDIRAGYLERVMAVATVSSHQFLISFNLTRRAEIKTFGYLQRDS